MALIKVNDAEGIILDWLAAKCAGYLHERPSGWTVVLPVAGVETTEPVYLPFPKSFSPSTRWAQGGPIKEREGIATRRSKGKWYAMLSDDLGDGERAQWCLYTFRGVPKGASTSRRCRFEGETELQAAMRCFCCSKLGDIVDVPEELCQ